MAAATSSDGASTSATTSLGKRARSPPSRLTDIGNGNGNDLGDGEGPASSDDDDDDDDLGPMPMPAAGDGSDVAGPSAASAGMAATVKRRKILRHERVYLENVPSADRYYRSFMHRDVVSHVAVTKTHFLLTASVDGHLKIWKKKDPNDTEGDAASGVGIEFVKHYRAHLSPILSLAVSADGRLAATVAADGQMLAAGGYKDNVKGSVKVFDIENFDMINILSLPYKPHSCTWVHPRKQARSLLAITEAQSHVVRIYDGRGDGNPLMTFENVHRKGSAVTLLAYNDAYDTVVSADDKGMIEYWQAREPFELPETPGLWKFKSDTDLYEFRKTKSLPDSITFSPTGSHFATTSLLTDRQVRIFSVLSGKLHRKYDESLQAVQELQQAGSSASTSAAEEGAGVLNMKLDEMEFGRRLAVERELTDRERSGAELSAARRENAAWDETGNFLLYPSLVGIKVINTVTNKLVRILGRDENHRFLNIGLYQGMPPKKGLQTIAMAASENPLLNQAVMKDPTLFCTAFKRSRFYLFSKLEPDSDTKTDRDVFNEKPTREEATIASATSASAPKMAAQATSATLHTTLGDIQLTLYPHAAPKAVENFVGHARSTYYEGVIFHRVIKKFMLQTGDPLGDGTGGESIWGKNFADEVTTTLKFDRPYVLAMANAGKGTNTNGSQFFITTTPTPHLNMAHTIFGVATSGYEVIHQIEAARTDKWDKPLKDIKIVSVTIH